MAWVIILQNSGVKGLALDRTYQLYTERKVKLIKSNTFVLTVEQTIQLSKGSSPNAQ